MKPNTNTDHIIKFANDNGYTGGDNELRQLIDQYVSRRVTEAEQRAIVRGALMGYACEDDDDFSELIKSLTP